MVSGRKVTTSAKSLKVRLGALSAFNKRDIFLYLEVALVGGIGSA